MAKIKTFEKDGTAFIDLDDTKEIARGGEGFLLPMPSNRTIVAKIYFPGCVNINELKFVYLNQLDDKLFIKPHKLLYNKSHAIIGITMEYLPKNYFPLDAIFNKNFCLQNKINNVVKEKISKQLVNAVKNAHSLNIHIGDLSALNVMINIQGEIKLIDVDSYEVPGTKHTDKLLEDIRDYFYGGHVCVNSDYFSLSVIIFNYLTYLHPFKGVHRKVARMAERMIKKLPVFIKDPELIIPKCYEQITDRYLQDQFEKLYLNGDRFLLSVDKLAMPVMGKRVQPQTITEAEVTLQNMITGEEIEYAFFTNHQGVIRSKNTFFIFDTSSRKQAFLKARLKRDEWQDVFIGNENIIVTKNEKLYLFDKSTEKTEEIINFKINLNARFIHIENLLIMLEDEYMYILDLDQIKYKHIKYTKTSAFGPGFMTHNGLIQNIGGIHYIHYHTGNSMSLIKSPTLLRGVIQRKDVGIAQIQENQKIKFKFYNINNSKFNFFQDTDSLSHFAYRGENSSAQDAMVFIPRDNEIEILRAMDLYKIADIKCSQISTDTKLYNTNAGLIVVNETEAWLLNKQ